MEHEILYKPSYAMAEVRLERGESILAESGCMVANSGNLEIKTSMTMNPDAGLFGKVSGLCGALARKALGGESIFLNTYTSPGGPGRLMLAPALTGDIIHRRLEGEGLMIQATSFLAATPGIELATRWSGFRGFLMGEGFFLLRASGTGDLFINCYGALYEHEVEGSFVVDTGHVVAFEESLNYEIRTAGNLKSTLFSGEGLVTEFSGRGKLYLQTRNLGSFIQWLLPMLPN